VVSADIRANTSLRIALRMTDAAESADVIDAPDAAYLSRAVPGRAYVRLGHASLVPFQAGRIGGRRPGAAAPDRPWVASAAWPSLGRPASRRPAARTAGEEITDLKLLVEQIRRAEAWQLRSPGIGSPLWALAGVGGDELTALGPDLSDGTPAFIVAGPARSGRSAVLASMTRSFLAGGAQVVLVTPRPSPLRALASSPGVTCSFEQSDIGKDELSAALTALTGPGAVVIDDADLLADCEAAGELSKIITRGGGCPLALVLAGDPDILASGIGGWLADARRARRGCLTAPRPCPKAT